MKYKVLIVLLSITSFQFISSCCKSSKYYDFSSMEVKPSSLNVPSGDTLSLVLVANNLIYLALNISDFGFFKALALQCDQGWGRMKFPIEQIEITSDTDFDADYQAGESLNKLFNIRKFNELGTSEETPLNTNEDINTYEFCLILPVKPSLGNSHTFKIRLIKSNTAEIILETEKITFQ